MGGDWSFDVEAVLTSERQEVQREALNRAWEQAYTARNVMVGQNIQEPTIAGALHEIMVILAPYRNQNQPKVTK